jgi:hypothetical protein
MLAPDDLDSMIDSFLLCAPVGYILMAAWGGRA